MGKLKRLHFLQCGIICLLLVMATGCNNGNRSGKLELEILNPKIVLSHVRELMDDSCINNCARIDYRLTNNSNANILLYGFDFSLSSGHYELQDLCTRKYTGKDIYLFNQDSSVLYPYTRFHYTHSKNFQRGLIPKINESMREIYRKTAVIIKKGESKSFSEVMDFREYLLIKKNRFMMKMVYYQGDLSDDLTQEEIADDSRIYEAYFFNGCLWSNPIELIVK